MSTTSDPQPGSAVGPYRLVRRLGAGGMGEVFEARDGVLDRRVALKLIAPGLCGDADFRARFVREARAQASLDSPHVVHVYGHGEDDGRLWIASQLVPDGDLGAMLRASGALPPRVALDLVAQVADGLADAHAAGLVHRDVKPSNVLLRGRPDGLTAYLADFGVARATDLETAGSEGAVGTPAYMAPELRAGQPASVASDVYAVGCLLWAALTGRPPPAGALRPLVATGPLAAEANRIVLRATSRRPGDRYPSAAALREELRAAALVPDTRAAARAPRGWWRPHVAAGVVVLAAAGVTVVATAGGRPDAGTARPRSSVAADEHTAVVSLAHALADRGVLRGVRAGCAARHWVDAVGLPEMVRAGLFDDDLDYVDVPRRELTPALRNAALAAVTACRGRPGP